MTTATLHIALRDGFWHDRVMVDIGDQRRTFEGLTTKFQIGLAEMFDIDVEHGTVAVTVVIAARDLRATTSLTIHAEHWLTVDLSTSGEVTFDEPDRFRFAGPHPSLV